MKCNFFLKMSLFFLLPMNNQIYAQNFRIGYQMTYKQDSLSNDNKMKEMILLYRDNKSKFTSKKQFERDSTLSNTNTVMKNTHRIIDYEFTVINDYSTGKLYKFTNILRDLYRTTSKIPDLKWSITTETKIIENFNCQKALLNYSNRNWEAWFTTDVPLHLGPYVFGQLPGLIVEMKDSKSNYSFNLIYIRKDEDLDVNLISSKFIDVSIDQLKKIKIDYYNDPYKEFKSGQIKVRWQDDDGKEFIPNYTELTKSEQRNLRKNNNPIELSELINYSHVK